MATLLPAAAMRPRRPAEPVSWVRMVEKVSDWRSRETVVSNFVGFYV